MPNKHKKDLVVIGASAGGVEALIPIVAALTADYAGSVFIVLHIPAEHPSRLSEVLTAVSRIPVSAPLDGELIKPGHVYVATSNHHLLVEHGRMRVTLGPKENRLRPSIDTLFRSAALAYGRRVVGVVVSGCLDDGSSGAFAIKSRHGTVIVQEPKEALYNSMPRNAIEAVEADFILPAGEIGQVLQRLSGESVATGTKKHRDRQLEAEVGVSIGDNGLMREILALGKFTPFTCPECHGALVEIVEGRLVRFRCHTGHAFTLSHLLAEVTQANEEAIISALRSIEETQFLLDRVHSHLKITGRGKAARLLQSRMELVKGQAELIKKASITNEVMSEDSFSAS